MEGSPVAFLIPAVVGALVAASTWFLLGKRLPEFQDGPQSLGGFWGGILGGLFCFAMFLLMALGVVEL